ncbi:hypothetical protein K402DRAFT_243538 [Aulographum hederae CBS 113979]|uniref:Uncharacterized protein n=1 Tax=Aulographum hederae CBS 113979 TaxID=1176131 RepID=A0A6G1HAF1_9PEZI|nr:hypothetical protein K402DRAFT_243538 [Aulographum hederae CBS 113979]
MGVELARPEVRTSEARVEVWIYPKVQENGVFPFLQSPRFQPSEKYNYLLASCLASSKRLLFLLLVALYFFTLPLRPFRSNPAESCNQGQQRMLREKSRHPSSPATDLNRTWTCNPRRIRVDASWLQMDQLVS